MDEQRPAGPTGDPAPANGAPPEEGYRRSRRRRRRTLTQTLLLYGGLFGTAVAVVILLFNLVIMPAFVRQNDEVRVPSVVGKDEVAAQNAVRNAKLILGESRRRNDPHPPGIVIKQQPAANSAVKEGRAVILTVSLGEPGHKIPRLAGETLRNAELALGDEELEVGRIMRAPAAGTPTDMIVTTVPAAGAELPRGGKVDILISTGTPDTHPGYLMPDLRGQNARDVEQKLLDAGMKVILNDHSTSFFNVGKGRIAAQDPPPGARVMPWSTIVLTSQ